MKVLLLVVVELLVGLTLKLDIRLSAPEVGGLFAGQKLLRRDRERSAKGYAGDNLNGCCCLGVAALLLDLGERLEEWGWLLLSGLLEGVL